MILFGYQADTLANWSAASNFDTMRALKSMPLRYDKNSRFVEICGCKRDVQNMEIFQFLQNSNIFEYICIDYW